ncbi:large subunit ribosomal protein LP1 [Nematocida sp. AWRm77]|nr:large subunit ribosomal protein LP1 [Nematocida sp. AWRm77]
MIEQKELCTLSVLLLHTAGVEVSQENMRKVAQHVGVEVDSYLLELFSKMPKEKLASIILNPFGSGAAPVASADVAEKKEEEKKDEKEEEEEEDSDDFGLF